MQEELDRLHKAERPMAELAARVGSLFVTTCWDVAGAFGFVSGRVGFELMLEAVRTHEADTTTFGMVKRIEELLRVPPGTCFHLH